MMTTSVLSDFAVRLRQFMARSIPSAAASSEALDEEFNGLALELCAWQRQFNSAYRTLTHAHEARLATIRHWTEIPCVPASAFKELELTCLPPAQRQTMFCSSGTTGQQASRHFHSAESLALYEASSWSWFRVHLLQDWAPQPTELHLVVLTPRAAEAPRSSLVHMFETINRQLGGAATNFCGAVDNDGSWTVDSMRVEAALEQAIQANRGVTLLGTAFSYVHCLDDWSTRRRRFALPSGSRVLETGGYKGRSRSLSKEELHRQLSASLGVPRKLIISEYGMSELSSQAYDGVANASYRDESPRLFRFPPWARAQVVSPETGREVADGETGLLRIFDLANVWSVLAVQTEDLAIHRGDAFEFIGRAPPAEPRGCSLMARDVTS